MAVACALMGHISEWESAISVREFNVSLTLNNSGLSFRMNYLPSQSNYLCNFLRTKIILRELPAFMKLI